MRVYARAISSTLLWLSVTAISDTSAWSQSLNFATSGDLPIEVFADNGIEWQQDSMVFIAQGNARAVRADVTVFADELRAYYRELAGGGTDIWRLDAMGTVRIKTPESNTYGEKAVYNVDKAVLVVSGGKVRLVTSTDTITADRQLEYWEEKQMAVARGSAQALHEEKKLNAEVLVAYFRKDKDGKSTIHRIDATVRASHRSTRSISSIPFVAIIPARARTRSPRTRARRRSIESTPSRARRRPPSRARVLVSPRSPSPPRARTRRGRDRDATRESIPRSSRKPSSSSRASRRRLFWKMNRPWGPDRDHRVVHRPRARDATTTDANAREAVVGGFLSPFLRVRIDASRRDVPSITQFFIRWHAFIRMNE